MKVKTIDLQVSKGRQSVDYKEIIKVEDNKLKICIKSDSYDFQSYADISRWDGDKWFKVHSIHYTQMKTLHSLHTKRNTLDWSSSSNFNVDRSRLLEVAMEIIQ